jgi:hypothetical protein
LGTDSADALHRSRGETQTHVRLKRLALIWAQAHGYSACALEMRLPKCRYRADLAAYRRDSDGVGTTAVFECKQALVDLRRDNGCTKAIRRRLEEIHQRRDVLEKNLRVHYPQLRIPDSLFSEFDSHDFAAIKHRNYTRVTRELCALQNRLSDCTKFETLVRYRCANLFYLVLPEELFRPFEIPPGWGALIESNRGLVVARKPILHEAVPEMGLRFLEQIAAAGTRTLNRQLEINFDQLGVARCRSHVGSA